MSRKTISITLLCLLMFQVWAGALLITADVVKAGNGTFGGGNGSAGNPYIITDVLDLQAMNTNLDAYYVLGSNIDASETIGWNSGAGFLPIGNLNDRFNGSLDGKKYNITGLFINRPTSDYVGLFGYVDTDGNVKNVGLIDNYVVGHYYVGGLIAKNNGTVSNTFTTGDTSGTDKGIGGLVGCNAIGGYIINSYATGDVSSVDEVVGGLIGTNTGTVDSSYATGNVTGYNGIGGFVGDNWWFSSISNCYAHGNVFKVPGGHTYYGGFVGNNGGGKIVNCYSIGRVDSFTNKGFAGTVSSTYEMHGDFWDIENSGQTTTSGTATGETTTRMKNTSTFVAAGWDFTNVWRITDGITYPLLRNLSQPTEPIDNTDDDSNQTDDTDDDVETNDTASGIDWTSIIIYIGVPTIICLTIIAVVYLITRRPKV